MTLGPVQRIGGQPQACTGIGGRQMAKAERLNWTFGSFFYRWSAGSFGDGYRTEDYVTTLQTDACVARVSTDAHDGFFPIALFFIARRSAEVRVEAIGLPEEAPPSVPVPGI